MEWYWLLVLVVVSGWGLNLLTTLVSTINDLWWGNLNIFQGAIACLAFSWVPFAVFFSGLIHFFKWAFSK